MLTKASGLIAFCQIMSIIAILYTMVGMIRPRWAWLGDNPPNRVVISMIGLVLFMASWTGYSELALRSKQAAAAAAAPEKPATAQQAAEALQKATESAPTVPPPPTGEKPTAKERADEALQKALQAAPTVPPPPK